MVPNKKKLRKEKEKLTKAKEEREKKSERRRTLVPGGKVKLVYQPCEPN